MATFEQSKAGYKKLWNEVEVRPERLPAIQRICGRILDRKQDYLEIESKTKVPWFMIACLHYRESDLDFATYLGNGQELARVTTEVPRGRGPFSSFVEGAIDALTLQGFQKIGTWSIERVLFESEDFNGKGYQRRSININSPYVWSYTQLYSVGKFSEDHGYDPNMVDKQCGVAAIIKVLVTLDKSVAEFVQGSSAPPVIPATQKEPTMAVNLSGLVKVTVALEAAVQYLPTIAMFLPALAPVAAFVPTIEKLLKVIENVEKAGTDPTAIMAALEDGFHEIATLIGQLKGTPAAALAAPMIASVVSKTAYTPHG